MISDVDEFAVMFPDNANVYSKGLLMAAGILIDYLYYEQSQNNNRRGHHGHGHGHGHVHLRF